MLGFFFGAKAGGIAFVSSAGALLGPFAGWRGLFLAVAAVAAAAFVGLLTVRHLVARRPSDDAPVMGVVMRNYLELHPAGRARRTYA